MNNYFVLVLFVSVACFNASYSDRIPMGEICKFCYYDPEDACNHEGNSLPIGSECRVCYGHTVVSPDGVYVGTCQNQDNALKCIGPWTTTCQP